MLEKKFIKIIFPGANCRVLLILIMWDLGVTFSLNG